MPKLPVLSGEELIKLFIRNGFTIVRQKGSHVTLQKQDYKTVVPLHNDLSKGTLLAILKQCGLSKDELVNLIQK